MDINSIEKENKRLNSQIMLLKCYNEHYVSIINKAKKYILKNSMYELPNKWIFKGDISFVYDLLCVQLNYKSK